MASLNTILILTQVCCVVTTVYRDACHVAAPIQGHDRLVGDEHGRDSELLHQDLCHPGLILLAGKRHLGDKQGLVTGLRLELGLDDMCPDGLQVVPVLDDALPDGLGDAEDAPEVLGLGANIAVLQAK